MTSEDVKKAIEVSKKLEKELLSLNKKDQWTLTKPTIQNFKITALDDLLTQGITVEPDLIFGSKEVVSNGVAIFPDLFSVFDSRPYECRLPGRGPTGLCDQVFGA